MKNGMGVVIGAALLAACGASGQGEGQAKAAAAATKPIDVAGVRLGMTRAEAEAAMKAGGWAVEPYKGLSWDQTVENAISIRRTQMGEMFTTQNGVGGLKGRKGDEELTAAFEQTPQGERVRSVGYAAPRGGRSEADLRTDLVRRYGQAVVNAGSNHGPLLYYTPQGREGPTLTTILDATRFRLDLEAGTTARRAWSASVDRAATAKAGPIGKSF